jgi:hypothetical protein
MGAGGALFLGPLLMIMFRQKYPRWWFDWNLELGRFSSRVSVYLALMDDRYPSTDDHQSVHLDYPYPDAASDLSRWLPLVKWLAAIPHYVVLLFLYIATFVVVIMARFAIVFTGTYPRGTFGFVEGVFLWTSRVTAYGFTSSPTNTRRSGWPGNRAGRSQVPGEPARGHGDRLVLEVGADRVVVSGATVRRSLPSLVSPFRRPLARSSPGTTCGRTTTSTG